jgi:dTDP-4-dehydrorhamnose 3,5-epimerase-like enzyme
VKSEIQLIKGGLAVDDRGEVSFINDFNFHNVNRSYIVSNHASGFVRAWHGHKREAKYVMVVKGAALIGAVEVDDWGSPSPDLKVARFVLSEKSPSVLFIPAGYANGFMSLTNDAKLIFFSTSTLEESLGDDYRFDSRLWDIWGIEER